MRTRLSGAVACATRSILTSLPRRSGAAGLDLLLDDLFGRFDCSRGRPGLIGDRLDHFVGFVDDLSGLALLFLGARPVIGIRPRPPPRWPRVAAAAGPDRTPVLGDAGTAHGAQSGGSEQEAERIVIGEFP